jgi:hypothetical protein
MNNKPFFLFEMSCNCLFGSGFLIFLIFFEKLRPGSSLSLFPIFELSICQRILRPNDIENHDEMKPEWVHVDHAAS